MTFQKKLILRTLSLSLSSFYFCVFFPSWLDSIFVEKCKLGEILNISVNKNLKRWIFFAISKFTWLNFVSVFKSLNVLRLVWKLMNAF